MSPGENRGANLPGFPVMLVRHPGEHSQGARTNAMTGSEPRSLLDAARELAPKIRAAADEIEAERELPRALFESLADAGFYHMAVPRSLGGAELDLPTYIQV